MAEYQTPKEVTAYIDSILRKEGATYTNDPADSGKGTKWGITEKTARANGYKGEIKDITRLMAFNIYLNKYWLKPGFHHVNERHPELAERLLDFGVVAGPETGVEMLQRCLNVLNQGGQDYKDLKVDGDLGDITMTALRGFLDKRGLQGGRLILAMVASLQTTYFIELAERRPKDEKWEYGWQLNRGIGAVLKL